MKLYRAYCYLYYQAYLWQKKVSFGFGTPWIAAIYEIATAAVFYIMGFFLLLHIIFGWEFLTTAVGNKVIMILVIFIPVMALHQYLFFYKRKYKKILVYYEENPPNKKVGSIIHWSYSIGAFVTFFLFLFLSILPDKYHFTLMGYLKSLF